MADGGQLEFTNGGSGGTVSPLTTKGDLYTYDTNNARLPVGSDGQVLTADSAQGTGIKWATASIPSGAIFPYAGSSAPSGYLMCDGSSVSRSTYSALYAVIGTNHGSIDGNSFNVPDLRGSFIRGDASGIGPSSAPTISTSSNTISCSLAHNFNRTGIKFRVSSAGGTIPTGLSAGTDYYAIVVNSTDFKAATTLANAIAGTAITISGGSGAINILQREDPEQSSRVQRTVGSNSSTTTALGTLQLDQFQGHLHTVDISNQNLFGAGGGGALRDGLGPKSSSSPITDGTNGTPRQGIETRPQNVTLNYIIKT